MCFVVSDGVSLPFLKVIFGHLNLVTYNLVE